MKVLRGRTDTESDDGKSLVGVIVVVTTDIPFLSLSLSLPHPLTLWYTFGGPSFLPSSFIHSTTNNLHNPDVP